MKAALFLLLAFAGLPMALAAGPAEAPQVRFEQRIAMNLPLNTILVDTTNASHPLRDFFAGRPVVLYFGYARCPQLCSVIADGVNDVLRRLAPSVGSDFDVIMVSIDPTETAGEATAAQLLSGRQYGRTGAGKGWHYLRGSETAVRDLTEAAGFHFEYDPRSKQYAHASGFLVVTPGGRISRYFLGVDFPAEEVASALEHAAKGQTGSTVYELLLLCFRGGTVGGRYGPLIWRILEASVALTVLTLGGSIAWMLRHDSGSTAKTEVRLP